MRYIGLAKHLVETVRLAREIPEVGLIETIISRNGEYKGHGKDGISKMRTVEVIRALQNNAYAIRCKEIFSGSPN